MKLNIDTIISSASMEMERFKAGDIGFSRLEREVTSRVNQEMKGIDPLVRRAASQIIISTLIRKTM